MTHEEACAKVKQLLAIDLEQVLENCLLRCPYCREHNTERVHVFQPTGTQGLLRCDGCAMEVRIEVVDIPRSAAAYPSWASYLAGRED